MKEEFYKLLADKAIEDAKQKAECQRHIYGDKSIGAIASIINGIGLFNYYYGKSLSEKYRMTESDNILYNDGYNNSK